MKAFRFSLDQILELRLEEEQEAEVRLGRAVSEWNRFRRDKQDREEKQKRILRERNPVDAVQVSLYTARLDQEIRKFQKEMDDREPRLEALREEYRKARAAREGLDKLKEKRLAEYRKKAQRQEYQNLDDISMNMSRMHRHSG